MAKGTIELALSAATSAGSYLAGKIEWESASDTKANNSDVTARIYVRKYNPNYTLTTSTSGTWTYKLAVNGSSTSGSVSAAVLEDWVLIAQKTVSGISHSSDGSKKITISGSVTAPAGTGFSGCTTGGSATVTLDTIARASTIGATDADIGAKTVIAVSRKNNSFTHSIAYKFGALSGYIGADWLPTEEETKLTDTSISFRLPESFYDQIPDSPSGVCTLTCRTYSGSTLIGIAQTDTFKVTAAKDLCKPEVSGTVADINETTLALTGDAGKLVRYMSTALCTITAQAINGASLKSKTIGGTAVTEDSLTVSGFEGESVVFSATDSRGYPGDHTEPVTLIPYIRLTCNASASRTDPTSGKGDLKLEGKYFDGSFGAADNTLEVKCRVGSGEYMTLEPQIGENSYTLTAQLTGLDYQSAHSIEVVVSDKLETVTKTVTVGKGIPVFDWSETDFAFHVPVSVDGTLSVTGAAAVAGDLAVTGGFKVGQKSMIDLVYPVGAIYMSVNTASPETLFGGTWEQLKDRFLLGAGSTYTAGSTGGSATHKLTVNEMPAHSHTGKYYSGAGASSGSVLEARAWDYTDSDIKVGQLTDSTGGGQAHNNMPPYLAVYMWERVA